MLSFGAFGSSLRNYLPNNDFERVSDIKIFFPLNTHDTLGRSPGSVRLSGGTISPPSMQRGDSLHGVALPEMSFVKKQSS